MNIFISVIIPLFNEESRLPRSFKEIKTALEQLNKKYEIIFVNDGSQDNTANIIEELKVENSGVLVIHNNKNMGKGFSLRRGILQSEGEIVLTTDIDLSVPMRFLHTFITALQGENDIVISSRKEPGAKIITQQKFLRRTLSNFYRGIARVFIDKYISDFTCGFKLYKGEIARDLFYKSRCKRWGIDTEILYLARAAGLRIKTIPVEWKDSGDSRVNLYYDVLYSFYELLKVRVVHRKT
jgi:glycosyltransferase involved in cell wall biosynthesis